MATIRTKERFRVPATTVWKYITDADLLRTLGGCDGIDGIEGCAGGLFEEGAVREVRIGGRRIVERIVNVRKGASLEVEVLDADGPIRQEYERVELIPFGGACELVWTIRFRIKIRVFERLMSLLVAVIAGFRFKRLVRKLRVHVEAAEQLARSSLMTSSVNPGIAGEIDPSLRRAS